MTSLTLVNVPVGPEGRAFLKQLRKSLPPEYRLRGRGCLKDRKALAVRRAQEKGEDVAYRHKLLRQAVACRDADRLRVYIELRPIPGIVQERGRWFVLQKNEKLGPFGSYDAARTAKRIADGTK